MKPTLILKSPLSGRYFATRAYKQEGQYITVTGKKEDVTEQVQEFIDAENDQLKAKLKIAIDALKVMEDLHAEGTINIPDSVWEQCLYQALEQTQESE